MPTVRQSRVQVGVKTATARDVKSAASEIRQLGKKLQDAKRPAEQFAIAGRLVEASHRLASSSLTTLASANTASVRASVKPARKVGSTKTAPKPPANRRKSAK